MDSKPALFWSLNDTQGGCGDAGGAQTRLGVNGIEKPLSGCTSLHDPGTHGMAHTDA